MSWLHALQHRIRVAIDPNGYERRLDEEMRHHLELDAMHQGGATRAGHRFGNRTYYVEERRANTWLSAFDAMRQDTRSAWRSITRAPSFAVMVVGTLALGIGANAAIFSLIDRLYLKAPSGIADAAMLRMYYVRHHTTGDGVPFAAPQFNYPMIREIVAASGDAASVTVFATDNSLRMGRGRASPKVRAVYASSNHLAVLGVRMARGRFYTADEDRLGAPAPVIVVGAGFAKRSLGGVHEVVGRSLEIDRKRYEIIGVISDDFTGMDLQAADVWIPLASIPTPTWMKEPWWESVNMYRLRAIQRVRPDTPERDIAHRATQRIRSLELETRPRHPDTLKTVLMGPILQGRGPGTPGQEMMISSRLAGVALIVLVIACANVINLLLARAVQRRRELAVRLAIGLPRWRLARMLLLEALMLATIAGVAALLAGWWGGELLRSLLLPEVVWRESAMDWRTGLVTVALSLGCGVVAGLTPAWQASKPQLTGALKAGVRDGVYQRSRLRTGLIVAQAALSVLLLVGAGLFVRSLDNVRGLDIGFDANRLLFAGVDFEEGEGLSSVVESATMSDVVQLLAERPGIEAIARTDLVPMLGFSFVGLYSGTDSLGSLGASAPTMVVASSGFFRTAGIRFLKGRDFAEGDAANVPDEMVVNAAMARRLWPGRDPLGQCVRLNKATNPCHIVIGMVETVRRDRVLEENEEPQFYVSLGSAPEGWGSGTTLIVRAAPEALSAVAVEVGRALRRAFPTGEIVLTPMTENLEPEYRPWRLGATLFSTFGLLAIVVALVGIYSTISYGVTQRTHEFGVRIALGAGIAAVLRQVVGDGVRTVAVGVLLGVALALAAGRLMTALLYGVKAHDPIILFGVSALVLVVTALAALIPAWRAARVDPVLVLRSE